MNWYKKAQENLVFRGTKTPETNPTTRDFPGIYFSFNPISAKKWGPHVSSYKIKNSNFFNPNVYSINNRDYNLVETFIYQYGYSPNVSSKQWKDMGAAQEKITNLTPDSYWNTLSQLMLFPTTNWVLYLKQLGYNGFINDTDLFIFDPKDVEYIGVYKPKGNIL